MHVPPAQVCTRSVHYSFGPVPNAPDGGRALTAGARPSLKGRLASITVRTPPALAHASPCPRFLLCSSLSPTRMPTNASEPVGEHGDGVRRLTHLNAARPREKVKERPALLESKSLSVLFHTHVQHVIHICSCAKEDG